MVSEGGGAEAGSGARALKKRDTRRCRGGRSDSIGAAGGIGAGEGMVGTGIASGKDGAGLIVETEELSAELKKLENRRWRGRGGAPMGGTITGDDSGVGGETVSGCAVARGDGVGL